MFTLSSESEKSLDAAFEFFNTGESYGGHTVADIARQIVEGISVAAEVARAGGCGSDDINRRADFINECVGVLSAEDVEASVIVRIRNRVSYSLTSRLDGQEIALSQCLSLSQDEQVFEFFDAIHPQRRPFFYDKSGSIWQAYLNTEECAEYQDWIDNEGGRDLGYTESDGLTLDLAVYLQKELEDKAAQDVRQRQA